ncbi:MAG: LamG domain-containing protein, partial [Planctomycetales bacterium]
MKLVDQEESPNESRAPRNEVGQSREVLQTDPADSTANSVVGAHACFVENNWRDGLSMLLKGNDAELKAAAAKELNETASLEQKLKLGEVWGRLAERTAHGEDYQNAMRRRAVYWLSQVLASEEGPSHRLARQRLRDLYVPLAKASDLDQDAVLLLGFDDDDPVYARDGSLLGNHGVVHQTRLTAGKVGTCYEFNGTGNSISLPTLNQALQADLTGLTIAAWIKPRGKESDRGYVFDVGHAADTSVTLAYLKGGVLHFSTPMKHGGRAVSHSGIPVGRWSHVAGVWDGRTQSLYLNGVRVAQTSTPDLKRLTAENVGGAVARLGICAKRNDARMKNWYFGGCLDEVAVYKRALSDDDVAAMYCRGEIGIDQRNTSRSDQPSWMNGVVLAFAFDADARESAGIGLQVNDLSGNNLHGAVNNSAFVPDHWGDALKIHNAGDFVDVPNQAIVNPQEAMSLAVWINVEQWARDRWDANIVGKDHWTKRTSSGYVLRCGGNAIGWNLAMRPWSEVRVGNLQANTWYHVVGSYGASGQKLYLNGV